VAASPSDEELVAFARTTLGDAVQAFSDEHLLREVVLEARDDWRILYLVAKGAADAPSQDDD